MSRHKSFFHNGDKIVFMTDDREGRLYDTYSLIAKNRFRWKNLPEGLESHKIEEYLYNTGEVAFFKDSVDIGDGRTKVEQFVCLPCETSGNFNIYGEPVAFNAIGIGYTKFLRSDELVRIKNNDHSSPTRRQVAFYTDWVNDIEKTMRKNLEQLRQPDIIATNKANELSMRNLWDKVKEGEEPIFYDKESYRGGEFPVQVLNRNVTNNLDSLQKNKDDVMFELLTFLGINNANTSKKERMIVDEVNVNNIHILMNLDVEYKNRKDACDLINEKFGLNVEVEMVIEELEDKFMKEEQPLDTETK